MFKKIFHIFVLLAFLTGLFLVTPVATAAASTAGETVSPAAFLNTDGTVNLSSGVSGTLDMKGYNVTLDPQRGPVFNKSSAVSYTPAVGDWEALGGGMPSRFTGDVFAVITDGTNLYVGGSFYNLFGNDAMDYLVKWNGSSWSAVGSGINGGGSIQGTIYSLGLDGANNLYAGGGFSAYNLGSYVTSHIARWNGSSWSALGPNGTNPINSYVYAVYPNGTDVYVGGYFTNANGIAAADYVAKWDGSNWSALGSNGSSDGSLSNGSSVRALTMIGTNLYVGGYFTDVNNSGSVLTAADYLAKWDGSNWSAVGNNGAGGGSLDYTVTALAKYGSNLYVGGYFGNVNNFGATLTAADYIAKWDGANWSALGSGPSGNGSLPWYVTSICFDGAGNVYVGGGFSTVYNGATPVNGAGKIAKFDGANWSGFGSDGSNGPALSGDVNTVAILGTDVYAGGYISNVNNNGTLLNSPYLARWDGSNWNGMTGAVNGVIEKTVFAVAVDGTNVYVGGDFLNLNNDPTIDYIAKWDGSTWSSLGNDGNGDGAVKYTVYALAAGGGNLYVGGGFYGVTQNGITDYTASYLAKWDGTTWSGIGSDGGVNSSLNNYVYSIVFDGSRLFVGGGFYDVNNNGTILTNADAVAMWDGTDWNALGSDGSSGGALTATYQYSYVTALAKDALGNLYVGGYFYDISNNGTPLPTADFIARWDGSNWHSLGSNGSGDGSLNGQVYALAVDSHNNLYAGGYFYNVVNSNGTPANSAAYLAKWDGSSWSGLGTDGFGGSSLGGAVHSLTLDPADNLYVGGEFADVNNNGTFLTAADRIAKWDGSNWSALGSNSSGGGSINYPGYATVYALAVSPSALYVGGYFMNVNNNGVTLNYADYVAAYGIDFTPPQVTSITRVNPDPTGLAQVDFNVTFSEMVSGVDESDFSLPASGVSGASITNIATADDIHYTVTVDTGLGNGTLGLNLVDDDSITDKVDLKLGGPGTGNGNLTGEVYAVSKTAPALLLPANVSTVHTLRPFFDWTNFGGAIGYQLQVSSASNFATLLLRISLTGPTNSQYTPVRDLPANTLLYWRVRHRINAFQFGQWSSPFTFTTGNPPSVPSLSAPANNILLTNLTPLLDWSDSTVPGGTTFDHYQVQLDDNTDFSSTVVDTNVGVSSYITPTLSTNTQYFWRVRAWNTASDVSAWSAVRSFREAMLAPSLLSPIGGTTVGSLKPTFDWSDVTGATGYTIQVSTSNTFGVLVINTTLKTSASTYTSALTLFSGKLYYWRVRANGPNGPSVWSTVETFNTP